MAEVHKQSLTAIWVSLISNILLTGMKLSAGFIFASPVLLADGVHNAGDIIATTAALTSSMVSQKPADEDHPYGHGKAEVVASAFVAVILVLAALWIGVQSIRSLFKPPELESMIALGAAFVSLIWKQALYFYTVRIGRAARSKSLLATAYDHLADVYASLAAVIGIGIGVIGAHFGWTWAGYGDPVAGIIVSLLVLKLAIAMGRESVDILMEKNATVEKLAEYEALIMAVGAPIKRIDRVRAREHGHYITVDVRVAIPAELTIQQGHDISRQIKESIMQADPDVVEVMVHLNPWSERKRV